ncbi:hypothetical protein ACJJTC_013587 [Scirpophaga incertulas]
MEETNTSLPYISDDDETNQIKELKEKLIDLQTKLTSAHNETEVLSLENINLKRNIEDLQNKNDILKKIASSPAKRKQTPQKKNKKITTSYSSGYPARVTAWLLIRHQPNQPSGATKAPHPHGVERPAATSKSLNHYSLCWRDSTSCSRVRLRAHDRRGHFLTSFWCRNPGTGAL